MDRLRKAWKKWVAIAVAILVILSCFTLVTGDVTQRLPDGTVVRFEGAAFGTNRFAYGTALQKLIGKWIPGRGIRLFGLRLAPPLLLPNFGSGGDPVMFCFTLESITDLESSAWTTNYSVVAFNEKGTQFENPFGQIMKIDSNKFLAQISLDTFPRDGKTVGVRFVRRNEAGQWEKAAEFVAPNKSQATPVEWKPGPLPQTNHLGSTAFILAECGLEESDEDSPPWRNHPRLAFRIEQDGEETEAWGVEWIGLFDASGNYQRVPLYPPQTSLEFTGRHAPDPRQVWRVEVLFGKRGGFLPEEIMVVPQIPFTGETVSVTHPFGPKVSARVTRGWLKVWLVPSEERFRLVLLSAEGANGRRVSMQQTPGQALHLQLLPSLYPADLTVAVVPQVRVNYCVQPELDR